MTRCVVFKRALLIKAVVERIVEFVRWEDGGGGCGVAGDKERFLLSLNRNISLTPTETELQNRMKREKSDLGSGGRRGGKWFCMNWGWRFFRSQTTLDTECKVLFLFHCGGVNALQGQTDKFKLPWVMYNDLHLPRTLTHRARPDRIWQSFALPSQMSARVLSNPGQIVMHNGLARMLLP